MSGGYVPRARSWQPEALTPDYKSSIKRSPRAALLSFPSSISEEASPIFGHALIGKLDNDLILHHAQPGQSAMP